MIIKDALKKAVKMLESQNIEEPILKSKIILSKCILKPKEYLIIHEDEEIMPEIEKDFFDKIERLSKNVPLQYITNTQEFMGIDFFVNENVLIPRSDTEILVQEVKKYIDNMESIKNSIKCNVESNIKNSQKTNQFNNRTNEKPIKLLDMCTGSGIIAVTLAKMCSKTNNNTKIEITAVDKSEKALEVAKKNAKLNNVQEQIKFVKSDMFTNLNEKYDIIVSNPPYIETEVIKTLSKDVQNEPQMALDGRQDGLYFYRIIVENIEKFLNKNGRIFVEIGYNQKDTVTKIFEQKVKKVECIKDLAGLDRVIIGK